MKKVILNYREAKQPTKKYYFNGSEVPKELAQEIETLGGNVVTERTDEWFWRNWS